MITFVVNKNFGLKKLIEKSKNKKENSLLLFFFL